MAKTVGARRGASHELLGHFVRAGGGDVSKAASLYLSMAEEFLELRDMARKRRSLGMPVPQLGDPAVHTLPSPPAGEMASAPGEVVASASVIRPGLAEGGVVSPAAGGVEVEDTAAGVGEGRCRGGGEGMQGAARRAEGSAALTSSGDSNVSSDDPESAAGDATAAAGARAPYSTGGREGTRGGSRPSPAGIDGAPQERPPHLLPQPLDQDFPSFEADPADLASGSDEYSVTISSQKLGMTVENVLERTVVRAAAPGGGAEAAGVETGSLLVALDGQSTK
ncbi:unnamed protein product, partial [Hapterophycus canaliculatus]